MSNYVTGPRAGQQKMGNDARRSEQPTTGTYFGPSGYSSTLKQPVASKADDELEQQIDELILKWTGKSVAGATGYSYKQQLLSLIQARDNQRDIETRIDEVRGVENYWDGEEFHVDDWQRRIAELKALKKEGK